MNSIVRSNLMKVEGYSPYCGSNTPRPPYGKGCDNPRTKFNGKQFCCPKCDFITTFPREFIDEYKKRWNIA